jgi:hypothetical protein
VDISVHPGTTVYLTWLAYFKSAPQFLQVLEPSVGCEPQR